MSDKKPEGVEKPKSLTGKTIAVAAAGAIGSAAVAAALLYANKRKEKNTAKTPSSTVPSGENPETD